MNIGIFTDTYFPQVSGVATSIKTLKNELEREGNQVYIFTTTDPHVDKDTYEHNIFRFSSIPFISFTDRRIAVRGLFQAYEIAKELNLDIVHTQTEFSMGMIGKFVAKNLNIPCVHTYHTMYEDYLHYVANGKLLKPVHVKEGTLAFCYHLAGVIAPSDRVLDKLTEYGVKCQMRIIPTGIDVGMYAKTVDDDIRAKYGIAQDAPLMLSISRLAYEKNITEIIKLLPEIVRQVPTVKLMIVGDGPAKEDLEQQVVDLKLEAHVIFTGEISNDHVNAFYQAANVFVSTSESESQGLTYIEAMAAGLPVVVTASDYTDGLLSSVTLGRTFTQPTEFVDIVTEYLEHPVDTHNSKAKALLTRKLHEISAETFGKRVVDFYQNVTVEQQLQKNSTASNLES
ncbi:glycosyltransferase family 4 protein [Lentilactobacillus parafarraginis]|jgi:1,2-diacylglycerol 3-alpha-glucosyltransferase|uniref:Glycosyltransferase, group 1 family protein n=2 Tax=Lentilactobacillus parafarraginis TaxID=390842 RepID=A0A0R1YTH2_9LACO|nr:glycosyltransferase family 4 protein [Lentilactobacillus parafarraginis]KRM45824.1 glycosyltransferase, group 1 family protein [Lentilactobacillus parafarraginis DSM 18390 = JCM 14109]TLQ19095.1 glycosyltransferase family 4 protein [Lentilactobacillus parafarraginis]